MKKFFIPFIITAVVGVLVSSSFLGVFVWKTNSMAELQTDFQNLTNDFQNQLDLYESITTDYENLLSEMEQALLEYQVLLNTYNILVDDNVALQGEYDDLLADYNLLLTNYDSLYASYTSLQTSYNDLQNDYDDLTNNFNNLQSAYDGLSVLYNELLSDYNTLQVQYDSLVIDYSTLLSEYILLQNYADGLEIELSAFKNYIQTLILPLQYSVFAEAVRRYYMPLYLDNQPTEKDAYKALAEYCRDIILHDSGQENSFQTVSNAFTDCLKYSSDTMSLAFYVMYWTFYDWLPNWDGYGLGSDLADIDTVVQWCIDEIDYEYDTDITTGQEDFAAYDYVKFPVETALRTMGDCEDQAILAAAYLESCGFETSMAVIHDPAHPVYGPFYHGALLVHIEQTALFNFLYPAGLWRFGSIDPYYPDYTWCWLDPTWDIPFGDVVPWVDDYGGSMSFDIFSIAICDIGGSIGQTGAMETNI